MDNVSRILYTSLTHNVILIPLLLMLPFQPLKRTKSDGTKPKGVDPSEAEARLNRAFTMPQFVTSVAGYGSSTRAKQVGGFGSSETTNHCRVFACRRVADVK